MPALIAVSVLPLAVVVLVVRHPGAVVALGITALGLTALLLWVWRLMLRPMRYRVADGVLEVPAHLRPVRVRLAGATVTRAPTTGWKVSGTALPPFRLGLF